MKNKLLFALKWIRSLLLHNLPLKLLSLLFAILLWSFVIATTPSIMGDKVFSGIEVTTSGQTVLVDRNLALVTNVSEVLPSVRVRLEAPQSSISSITSGMVRVELDLSSIRQPGKQSVKLRGTSLTGRVTRIWPEVIDLEVEETDTRYVSVNIDLVGKDENRYRYDIIDAKTNPAQIVLKGPASIVRQVTTAQVTLDVSGLTGTFTRSASFALLNSMGSPVENADMLTRSTSSVIVDVDVYPSKRLSIPSDLNELLIGELPEGYEIEKISMQPETVTVAGDQALVDAMHELTIEPIDLTGQKSTFNQNCKIFMLENFKYKSSDQVSITVTIREKTVVERFSEIPITFTGKSKDTTVEVSASRIDVRATGEFEDVKALKKGDLIAFVDLTGFTDGVHNLPVQVVADNYPDITFTVEPELIEVNITHSEK